MIVKAIIDRIKAEQDLITRIVALGDVDDTNIGRGNEPYIIVGELDNNDVETLVRIRVCYPKGASAYLDDFVMYKLYDMFNRYYMTVKNLAGDVVTHTVTTVDKTVSGTGYTSDGFIFRDRVILVPCLI